MLLPHVWTELWAPLSDLKSHEPPGLTLCKHASHVMNSYFSKSGISKKKIQNIENTGTLQPHRHSGLRVSHNCPGLDSCRARCLMRKQTENNCRSNLRNLQHSYCLFATHRRFYFAQYGTNKEVSCIISTAVR